ncbi:anaerobic ribonucleoside-triphosphate reductase [Gemella sp. GH3]|uniref:anaerobic ribonucleoside-triphosphate reductase n=1 Tax=unclassified Gemella TaxID=2624949 RepID=UPI0015D05982|nr:MULTISPECIES: anaerobic ribonucleoside-triphosphate reductase [unclassified Gemella]MBF0713412.1 anaerobic ribonucleoside-triphosphate reductase [Gemella sp. GH3.1]NYS50364.1 anaerobic ribonucleoside-triphosphate reductase [Gemella sp. GH3]
MKKLEFVEENLRNKLNNFIVIKRDGRRVEFECDKIYAAISKAILSIDGNISTYDISKIMKEILSEITTRFSNDIKIYEIQSVVEHTLIKLGEEVLAESYISYRTKKDIERDKNLDINFAIKKLVNRDENLVNENANKDSLVFNTHRDLTSGVVAKTIGLKMLPTHVANAHQKGELHYHDLDYSPYQPLTNCCLIDFQEMLTKGFKIGNADVESPKSITTSTAQMAQIIANVASSQYGGCSADRIDEVLAPFAKLNYKKNLELAKEWIDGKEKQEQFAKEKTIKDIYDAMQSLEYEINTLYSSQGQTPFTSLGFGLGEDFFSREIQKAILKVRIEGLGIEKRTAIFPKLIFTIKDGVNLKSTDPNYDIKKLALECSTKRMYPDVIMYDTLVKITGSCKTPMGCRSFLPAWKDELGNNVESGRMNLGVVTLNLPRIAIESNGIKDKFWQLLRDRLEICKDALVYRAKRCGEAKPENAPILYMHGAFGKRLDSTDSVNQLFKNKRSTLSLGYIGLYEVATLFYGGEWETNKEAKQFTLDIMKELKRNVDLWTEEYDYWFSIYSTPSESLTDRFCRLDKEKYGSIKNVTDKDYYTNSYHYDVRKKPTPFEKLDFEKDYPYYASGGFIHYCEYPVLKQNPKALEAVWDYAYDKVGYLGTNTPIDRCYECDYEGDFEPTKKGFKCPNCGNNNPKTCDVVKRTCGYLGNPQARPMIKGRHKEIVSRVKHMN